MTSSTQELGRVQLTSTYGSAFWCPDLLTMPRPPLCTNPFITEHLQIQPISGASQPGGTVIFEIPYSTDLIRSLTLAVQVNQGVVGGAGTSTFAELVDYFGLALLQELRINFGTERLQTVRREEIYGKQNQLMIDEDRNKRRAMFGGNLLPAARRARLTAGRQWFYISLDYLLGLHLGAPPPLAIHQRMLGERIRIEIDLAPANTLCISDGTWTFAGTGAAVANNPTESAWFNQLYLLAEGEHLTKSARMSLEKVYQVRKELECDYYVGCDNYDKANGTWRFQRKISRRCSRTFRLFQFLSLPAPGRDQKLKQHNQFQNN